jgi:hypothetical protein
VKPASTRDDGAHPATETTRLATLVDTMLVPTQGVTAVDEIDEERTDTFAPFLTRNSPPGEAPHFLDLITFEGDAALQRDCCTLCTEFSHIFSDKLGDIPTKH